MIDAPRLCCAACGAPLLEDDRYCERCGRRCADTSSDDSARRELDLGFAAAVSERGRAHARNDDAFELRTGSDGQAAVVVCDGISAAAAGDLAARVAAAAAITPLELALDGADTDAAAATIEAVRGAATAVKRVPWSTRAGHDPPSCTFVSAVCRGAALTVGWLGDSRAYWISPREARQLTSDDSWAGEQVAQGLLDAAQAMTDPRAHAVTRWIGADAASDQPRLVELRADEPGHAILCTDGLWNYLATPAELGRLVRALPTAAAPVAIARSLAETAGGRGGHDDITVAVVAVRP